MRLRKRLREFGAVLLAALGVGAASGAPAGPLAAEQAPQAWVAYAHRVSQQFQNALEGNSDEARRFHAFFEQRALPAEQKEPDADNAGMPPMLSIKTWLDANGRIVRVAFAPLGSAQADADLRNLLMAQRAGAPPRGMRQPLVVRLQLSEASQGEASGGQSGPALAPLAAQRSRPTHSQEE